MHSLTATELLKKYRARELSPVEVAMALLKRIDDLQPRLNAFCYLSPDHTLAQAKASEQRWMRGQPMGLLDGVPVSIKDIVATQGWPTLRGSKLVDSKGPWNYDAPATARLRENGAVLIGKTTTPEFAWKVLADSPLTGITRNPWDPEMTPGGSSGGAAAAVASGMGPLAVATDGGGSIRVPCAFTGVFGIKPSFGRVPVWPLTALGSTAHIGPISRSVADSALLLNVLALPDGRDWDTLPYEPRDWRIGLEDGVRGLRIAWSPDLGYATVDPEVSALCADAVTVFADLHARVEEKHPGFEEPEAIYRTHMFSGTAFFLKNFSNDQRSQMDPGLVEVAELGGRITAHELLDAQVRRGALGAHMNLFHRDYDLLVTPTVPVSAFDVGLQGPSGFSGKQWTEWTPFTYPFNLTRQPAASIPCGFTKAGLPVGLQIVGPRHADALVLRAARAFETARPIRLPS